VIEEARLKETESGFVPANEGWFVVNVGDTAWDTHETFGASCTFEGPEAEFGQLGINLNVLAPGQPLCMYHRESAQEDFLVLSGTCLLLVEEQERPLSAWDFVHCPPETDHVFVGAGDGPCVILAVGVRQEVERIVYPKSELARRHGAGVESETPSPDEAYAPYRGQKRNARPQGWDALPWARTSES
jgi:uncharacterized cupin superfamily protein